MFEAKQNTARFHHVRLELAREREHQKDNRRIGYDLVVPLDGNGHLDPAEWKAHRDGCRVRRFLDGEEDRMGQLRRKRGGHWFFDYAQGEDDDEEIGFRSGRERFVPGEHVSVFNNQAMHTFVVKSTV